MEEGRIRERVAALGSRVVGDLTGRPGLRREILFSLGVLILGAVFALGAAALSASERLLLAQRNSALMQTALALGQALAEARAAGGDAGLERAVERMARDLSLESLVVTDPEGRVLAGSRPGLKGPRVSDPALARAWRTGGVVTPGEVEGRRPDPWRSWTFAAPLPGPGRGGEARPAGGFTATFPAVDVAWAVRWHRWMILLFALVDLAVIMLFGNLLLGRVAVRPLQGLAKASLAFAGGQRGVRAPVEGSREVASLAQTFNEMADRVEEGLARQQEQLAALTRANLELRAAQEELVRVEKMASVGRLAAGVAHEIGNPLSAILGYTGLLLREKPGGEAGEYLSFIERETERIRRIITELLEFSRPSEVRAEETDPGELVASALDLVRPQGEFREVAISLSPGGGEGGGPLPPVMADRHQITQVLVNLFLNAAQAMEGRGELVVETSVWRAPPGGPPAGPRRRATDLAGPGGERPAGDRIPGVPAAPAGGRWVRVAVRDTGPGIPPGTEGRLFDPFFTTKPPGKGTGLGLSLAWGIVTAHGGVIRAGARGDGTRGAEFTVDLPAAR